jgi:uncharacterized membrane protein YfcA
VSIGLAVELFGVAVVANAMGSALGMAGGIFIVPVLTGLVHAPLPVAIAVSLVSVIACSCASAPRFLSAGITDIRLAVVLGLATTSGAFLGVLLVGHIDGRILFALFTAVLLLSAVQLVAGRRADRAPVPAETATLGDRLRLGGSAPAPDGALVAYRVHRVPLGLALMFAAGLLATLLGIGSGVLKIPAMDSALRLPLKVSSATANLMIGVTAAGGAAAYALRGEVAPALVGPVVLGSVLGAVLGARVLVRAGTGGLRITFAVILVGLAVLTTFAVAGTGPFGGPA